jgi:hypothetical protein
MTCEICKDYPHWKRWRRHECKDPLVEKLAELSRKVKEIKLMEEEKAEIKKKIENYGKD